MLGDVSDSETIDAVPDEENAIKDSAENDNNPPKVDVVTDQFNEPDDIL